MFNYLRLFTVKYDNLLHGNAIPSQNIPENKPETKPEIKPETKHHRRKRQPKTTENIYAKHYTDLLNLEKNLSPVPT